MKKTFIIGITGGSGSGKTTFLRKLAEGFTDDELCVLSQDDYYRSRLEQKVDKNGIQNFDLPESIDDEAFSNDLQQIISGRTVQRPEYLFNNSNATPKILTFRPAPIVLVEGIFIFHFPKIVQQLDFKVFIEARDDLKVIRRIKRDKNERNYPLEDVVYRYENHVMPAYERYTKPYMSASDVIINNHKNFDKALAMMRAFLRHQVEEIPQL